MRGNVSESAVYAGYFCFGRLAGISKDIFPHVSLAGLNIFTYCMVPVGMFIPIGQAQMLLTKHTLPKTFADFVLCEAVTASHGIAEHLRSPAKRGLENTTSVSNVPLAQPVLLRPVLEHSELRGDATPSVEQGQFPGTQPDATRQLAEEPSKRGFAYARTRNSVPLAQPVSLEENTQDPPRHDSVQQEVRNQTNIKTISNPLCEHGMGVFLLPLPSTNDASDNDDSDDSDDSDDRQLYGGNIALLRRTACPACDSSNAMFNFDVFLAFLNRALLHTVYGKTYRNDRGEDMGPAMSMYAYCNGFRSKHDSFVATGDCEDWMAKFVQLCRTRANALRDRLSAMDPNITCEIEGVRVEFIPPTGESMCHTTTGLLYCNAHTGMCEIHVVENTDSILIADKPCAKIAKFFNRTLSTAEAHSKYRCVQWFGEMLVFEMTCGLFYCGARCYMPYAGTPIRVCTQRDLQRLIESPYACNEPRLVLMDVALYFDMYDHITFAECVPRIPDAKRCFLVDYIMLLRKYQPILSIYFNEDVENTRKAADAWVALQRGNDVQEDVQCRLSSANFRHGVFEQIKPLP